MHSIITTKILWRLSDCTSFCLCHFQSPPAQKTVVCIHVHACNESGKQSRSLLILHHLHISRSPGLARTVVASRGLLSSSHLPSLLANISFIENQEPTELYHTISRESLQFLSHSPGPERIGDLSSAWDHSWEGGRCRVAGGAQHGYEGALSSIPSSNNPKRPCFIVTIDSWSMFVLCARHESESNMMFYSMEVAATGVRPGTTLLSSNTSFLKPLLDLL